MGTTKQQFDVYNVKQQGDERIWEKVGVVSTMENSSDLTLTFVGFFIPDLILRPCDKAKR